MPIIQSHLKGRFNLDSSGIAGFFGGEEAFGAMRSVHLVRARRWLGWYNSPGSYFVAKRYGTLPRSTFWDSLFPGPFSGPTELLELDNKPVWRFSGAYNGNQEAITGHLSSLISQYCAEHPAQRFPWHVDVRVASSREGGKSTLSSDIDWSDNRHRNITVTIVKFDDCGLTKWSGYPKIPESYFTPLSIQGTVFIVFTITFTLAASIVASLYGDWFSLSMILLGALSNGITSLVLGTGHLNLEVSEPFVDATPGDGVLYDRQNIIILQGSEHIIDTILKSRFRLTYPHDHNHQKIGLCALLLLAQFLLQLFLIPQGALVGQVMFLSTLAASWMCNSYLASFDQEKLQTDLLFKLIGTPRVYKMSLEKWATAVAFTMFYFPNFETPERMLNELMANDTHGWTLWKKCIGKAILLGTKPSSFVFDGDGSSPSNQDGKSESESESGHLSLEEEYKNLTSEKDKKFVKSLLRRADEAFVGARKLDLNLTYVEKTREK